MEKYVPQTKAAQIHSPTLQPIIDILQYRVFCERVEMELCKAVDALNSAGMLSTLSFTSVGEAGQLLVSLLSGSGKKVVGGEAIIRMVNWCVCQPTFLAKGLRKD
jgi:mediator of RNA polymerase II transcription subunit 17